MRGRENSGKNEAHTPRVGLNAHLLSQSASYRSAGVSHYIAGLVAHLPEADRGLQYVALLGDRRVPSPGWERWISPWRTEHPLSRIAWEQAIQPWSARHAELDLLHVPVYVGPAMARCPLVVTVHDLSFYLYPDLFRPWQRFYLQTLTRRTVEQAVGVIAVSENTRTDAVRLLGIPAHKVTVIPNGLDRALHPLPKEKVQAWQWARQLPARFILYLGTLEPRKNITMLLEAYSLLPRTAPSLIIAGGRGWYYDTIYAAVERYALRDRVYFPGFVPQEELVWWYNAAELFVYPSLYEGFGWPPLEAMACGTPVVASRASSLPEVVGEAGVLVDSYDTQGLASVLRELLSCPEQRRSLSEAGLARARIFSWQRTASRTAALYRELLKGETDGPSSQT